MKIAGEGKLLRIFVGEADRVRGLPLHQALVERARELGLAGASRIHTARILRLSEDLPVLIEIVDLEDRIREALPRLEELLETAGGGGS